MLPYLLISYPTPFHPGLMTVLDMPYNSVTSAYFYYGQALANYDCHARNKHTANFIAMLDHDEYILPLQHSSWMEVINHIENSEEEKNNRSAIAVFNFQHKFFCQNRTLADSSEWADIKTKLSLSDEESRFIHENKVSLFLRSVTRGADAFWVFGRRQKVIMRPDLVLEPATHAPRYIADRSRRYDVSHSLAFLVHQWKLWDDSCVHYEFHYTSFLRSYLDNIIKAKRDFDTFVRISKPDST